MNLVKRYLPAIVLTTGLAITGGCRDKEKYTEKTPVIQNDEQLMNQGLDLLYAKNDPIGAEQVFKAILARNPAHYGAHFQQAVALDRGGKPADARLVWTEVLRLSTETGDTVTSNSARARLAQPDTASTDAMMVIALDMMYRQNNAAGAIDQFQAVLKKNPTHYGATFQLATALDRANRQAEALPLWTKVLGMAETYKDSATARIARERLK